MSDTAPNCPTDFQPAADIAPRSVPWLWPGWLGRGVLAVLDGEAGAGKSLVAIDLAARVSRGFVAPGTDAPAADPAGVVLLAAHDSPAAVLRPRLEAAGADLARVLLHGGSLDVAEDIDDLRGAVERQCAALVVLDPA
jgi:hypothetical protein